MTECPERTVAAWIWMVPPLATPIFALLDVDLVLRRFILHPETFNRAVYDKHVENRLAHEGLEDEKTMLSLDHPDGITPTVRHRGMSEQMRYKRMQKAILRLPPKKRYLSRVLWAIYYHGRNVKAILKSLKMSRQAYCNARNWLYVYFVIQRNCERI